MATGWLSNSMVPGHARFFARSRCRSVPLDRGWFRHAAGTGSYWRWLLAGMRGAPGKLHGHSAQADPKQHKSDRHYRQRKPVKCSSRVRPATGVRVRADQHDTIHEQEPGCHPPQADPSPPDASEARAGQLATSRTVMRPPTGRVDLVGRVLSGGGVADPEGTPWGQLLKWSG